MLKYLIVTDNKRIPYKAILHEINPNNIAFIVPKNLFDPQEKILARKEGLKIYEIDNYLENGLIEKYCYDLYQDFAYDRLIAHAEKDILWAGKVRDLLKIKGQSYSSALTFRDKYLMKQLLSKNDFKTPYFAKIEAASDLIKFTQSQSFPIVIKPCRASAATGIKILTNIKDMDEFIQECLTTTHESNWIAESYINGTMYQIDGIIEEGKVAFVWPSKSINHWLDIKSGKVVGRYFLEPSHFLLKRLEEYSKKIVLLFPLEENAIFHLEVFYEPNSDDFVFCEIASRVGGMRGRNVWLNSFGIDLGAEFIRSQAGLDFSLPIPQIAVPKFIDGYLLFPKKEGYIKNLPKHCSIQGIKEYKSFIEIDKNYRASQNLSEISCLLTISALSEAEFLSKYEESLKWYEENYKWDTLQI